MSSSVEAAANRGGWDFVQLKEDGSVRSRLAFALLLGALLCCSCVSCPRQNLSVDPHMALVSADPKPFVIIGGGQGVVVSPDGHVLTAAHVTFDEASSDHKDEVTVAFRKRTLKLWPGAIGQHGTKVMDAGPVTFYEESYKAAVIKKGKSAMIDKKDLGVLKIDTSAKLPYVEFYSREKPEIKIGDRLYLCHFVFPTNAGEPTFLVSPLEVIGAAHTTMGPQYLAKGFFRWGSSGSAILKDGKLIGIQSNAFTVNTRRAGEIPLGHVSFELVYEKKIENWLGEPLSKPSEDPR